MSAFDAAWVILKRYNLGDVRKAAPGSVWLERARQYVLDNQNHPHPTVQQSVEELHRWLTDYSSKTLAGGPDPGPMPKVYDMHEIMEFNEEARGYPAQPWYSSVDYPYSSGIEDVPDDAFFDEIPDAPYAPKAEQPSARARYRPARHDGDDEASATPMEKAFRVLIDSHFA